MKRASILALIFLTVLAAQAQYYRISGRVFSHRMEPLAYATVFLKDIEYGTTTNDTGYFIMDLGAGSYYLVVSMTGYKTRTIYVTVDKPLTGQNIILEPEGGSTVVITSKRTDPSLRIIQNAIRVKENYLEQYSGYTARLYIKASQTQEKSEKKKDKKQKKDSGYHDPLKMAEVLITRHFKYPDKVREIRSAVKIDGQSADYFYLSGTDGDFNLYRNLIKIPALSETPFLGPLNPGAPLAYKFKLLETYYLNGHLIWRIGLSPRNTGANTALSGEVHISDSNWAIVKADVRFPQEHISEFKPFRMKQNLIWLNDSIQVMESMEFLYGRPHSDGNTLVRFDSFQINPVWPKRFFGDELSITATEAYERDSSFWAKIRPVALTEEEFRHIQRSDSIKAAHKRTDYMDSIQKQTNKINFWRLSVAGIEYMNHRKEVFMNFPSLVGVCQFYSIGGFRLGGWVYYDKTWKDKRNLVLFPNLSYGIVNKDLNGSLSARYLYNPFTRSSWSINAGRQLGLIFDNDAFINLLRPTNWYRMVNATIGHEKELLNGLFLDISAGYAARQSLLHYQFNGIVETTFYDSVKAIGFGYYNAFYSTVSLRYTHKQKYLREPHEKLILGSKFPTVYLEWKRGIPGIFNSGINYDYIELGIRHTFKFGLVGNSTWNIKSGTFTNKKQLLYVDYKFQRRGDPFFFTNPIYYFQMLDSTFPTFKLFVEGHYFHRFNGAILSKIPFMKKLGLKESVGGGFLIAPEKKLHHFEVFAGLEKPLRIAETRFRIGIFWASHYSNLGFNLAPQIKFALDFYDRNRNKWTY